MSKSLICSSSFLALALLSVAAHASVKVNFVDAGGYSDVRGSGSVLPEIRQHLQALGTRYLKPGRSLSIDVLDVDLAGEFEPWRRGPSEIRVLRGITPPRITLRYTLQHQGRVIMRGSDTISDLNYQMRSARFLSSRLGFEKDMLTDWFRDRFQSK